MNSFAFGTVEVSQPEASLVLVFCKAVDMVAVIVAKH
jgi:hypothetical protein